MHSTSVEVKRSKCKKRKSRRDGIILENYKQTEENPEGMTLF